METNNLKNIIVLKNLPSNLIEEAIIILKNNKQVRKFEYVETELKHFKKDNKKTKEYIIKEAETVLSNYISNTENNSISNPNINIEKKYKRLKIFSIITTVIIILSIFL